MLRVQSILLTHEAADLLMFLLPYFPHPERMGKEEAHHLLKSGCLMDE